MPPRTTSRTQAQDPPLIEVEASRRLLLGGQGLLSDPARKATPAAVHRQIEAMGFVQVDTINIVERAHHHILRSRFDDYRPDMLTRLLERDRKLFEHWTHDASVIPAKWFHCWKVRFDRYRRRGHARKGWWAERMGGDPERVTAHVRERIEAEGPLMSKDFEHNGDGAGPWWGWKPQKAALEYLWRSGELAINARVNFHKVYDLTHRVFPDLHDADAPDQDDHIAWACRAALDRLGAGTPAELSAFMRAIDQHEAGAWCKAAAARGEIMPVLIEHADGTKPRRAYACLDWRRRASRFGDPPDRMRLLSPFDPVIRDRRRALRLFGFDYRFEAFVPAPKRRYGYYVLPVLHRDRFVARVDPKLHRGEGHLEIKGVWWQPDVKVTRTLRRTLEDAVAEFAASLGADHVSLPTGRGTLKA